MTDRNLTAEKRTGPSFTPWPHAKEMNLYPLTRGSAALERLRHLDRAVRFVVKTNMSEQAMVAHLKQVLKEIGRVPK